MEPASGKFTAALRRFGELFGDLRRSAMRREFLVSLLLLALLAVSWVSSAIGISHLANVEGSDWSVAIFLLVLLASLAITTLMWVLLERSRLPGSPLSRALCFIFYIYVFCWAVGFGYSFWWNAIAARASSTESISNVLSSLDGDVREAQTRLEGITSSLTVLASSSESSAQDENVRGSTCGLPSGDGRGPLWTARQQVNRTISTTVDSLNQGWVQRTTTKLNALQTDRSNIAQLSESGATSTERNTQFSAMYDRARAAAASLNQEQRNAEAVAGSLRELAAGLKIRPGEAGFLCHDPGLASMLEGIASQIERPVTISIPPWQPMEGNKSTQVAFMKLAATFLPWTADGSVLPMAGRDWIALLAALAVDLGIFGLTLLRPRSGGEIFMTDQRVDPEVHSILSALLRRHRTAAMWIFHDLRFAIGRRHYVAMPDSYWDGPDGVQSRDLHNALAAVGSRLSATRVAWPSAELLGGATERLRRAGWYPRRSDETAAPISYGRVRRFMRLEGREVPANPPLVFRLPAQDLELATRILDEGRERAAAERAAGSDIYAVAASSSARKPDVLVEASADETLVDTVYLAAMTLNEQGLNQHAEGLFQAVRNALPELKAKGIDVLGLDIAPGTRLAPEAPFIRAGRVPSALPEGTVTRVTRLAFVQREGDTIQSVREGQVLVSSGVSAASEVASESEPAS